MENTIKKEQDKVEEKVNKKFRSNSSLTLMLMMIAGFLTFWLLVAGSLTENRFGTHILFNSDMKSSPLWYSLSISYISILFMIGSMVLLSLDLRGKLKLNSSQEKIIRISSFLVIGISGFMIGISAISFAAFQTEFFKSQLFHPHMFGKLAVADQGLAIGSLSIILIVGVMAIMTFLLFAKVEFNDKLYFTFRNVSIASVAAGWFIFNMNINAFGAMGGDLNTIVKGLSDGKFDLSSVDGHTWLGWSQMTAKNFYKDVLKPFIDDGEFLDIKLPIYSLVSKWFDPIWNGGHVPGLVSKWKSFDIPEGHGLQNVLYNTSFVVSGLDKPSLLFGTNNSIQAILLFATTMGLIVALPTYGIISYYKVEDNSKSITYDFSVFVIFAVTALYGVLAWITPYIPFGDNGDNYTMSIIDALYNGKYNAIAPGLIAPPGMHGGISSAVVYYFPFYKGTIVWWMSFGLMFIIPVVGLINSIYINNFEKGTAMNKFGKLKANFSKEKEETKDN